ncbi:ROK family transcriptional regulator [uncultured Oscillibacter sp.]|uniref:ROK family transcriptional regulator n=1 Tax=uncultured Oscillibacter sp. TaxID=876091 RepID=UPI0025F11900|nr:ROK family transcriptional regulator [uncultured Oscillibacter sp.]
MDVTDIKAQNIKRILEVLRISGGTTKNEIAAITGLSFSTVSNLCNELKEQGVLVEEKISSISVGRIPSIQIFKCSRYASVCIDFQQEGILNFSILNFANKRLYQTFFDISGMQEISLLTDLIETTYRDAVCQMADIRIVGVGVSIPGIYDESTGLIINSTVSVLNHTSLKELLEQRLKLPCHVENESNLCALSICQERPEIRNAVYLHSSSGLGVGVICEGHLLKGKNGYAAEVAHMPIGTPDVECPFCGNSGCIESDLSQRGMETLRFPTHSDEVRARLMEDRAEKLGALLSILVNLFDPDVVYIGGRGFAEYGRLESTVLRVLRRRSPLGMGKELEILHDTDSLRAIEKGVTQVIYDKWNPLQK